jgi:hypothetical protein
MDAYTNAFATLIRETVTDRIVGESRAGHPLGTTNRSFEAITGELIMARWDALAAGPGTIGQIVARMCGTEKRPPEYRPEGARTWRTAHGRRRRAH